MLQETYDLTCGPCSGTQHTNVREHRTEAMGSHLCDNMSIFYEHHVNHKICQIAIRWPVYPENMQAYMLTANSACPTCGGICAATPLGKPEVELRFRLTGTHLSL